jgi:hypothetical protein
MKNFKFSFWGVVIAIVFLIMLMMTSGMIQTVLFVAAGVAVAGYLGKDIFGHVATKKQVMMNWSPKDQASQQGKLNYA